MQYKEHTKVKLTIIVTTVLIRSDCLVWFLSVNLDWFLFHNEAGDAVVVNGASIQENDTRLFLERIGRLAYSEHVVSLGR